MVNTMFFFIIIIIIYINKLCRGFKYKYFCVLIAVKLFVG